MSEIKIGYVLKRVLREQRRTLKEVSRHAQIPYSTLHTWYENRQPKDLVKALRLADYLGISLCQLLFDQDDAHGQKPSGPLPIRPEDFFSGAFEIVVRKLS